MSTVDMSAALVITVHAKEGIASPRVVTAAVQLNFQLHGKWSKMIGTCYQL